MSSLYVGVICVLVRDWVKRTDNIMIDRKNRELKEAVELLSRRDTKDFPQGRNESPSTPFAHIDLDPCQEGDATLFGALDGRSGRVLVGSCFLFLLFWLSGDW